MTGGKVSIGLAGMGSLGLGQGVAIQWDQRNVRDGPVCIYPAGIRFLEQIIGDLASRT